MSLIVPPGTRVVTREAVVLPESGSSLPAGAVAVIVRAPADGLHSYRVQFPDASEASLKREEFTILKSMKDESTDRAADG